MSDAPPSSTADAPGDGPKAPKPAKGVKGALSKKVGPLPVGVWLLAFAGGLAVAMVIRRRAVANEAAAGTVEEGTGTGWDQLDPGGTNPGVGGGTGGGAGGGGWTDDGWTTPLPDLPWIDSPWLDPPEPSVPGTAGGAPPGQPNNGGPTGLAKHRYVRKSENDPHCKVCGKWRDTAVHTNRDAPKQQQPPKQQPPKQQPPKQQPPRAGERPSDKQPDRPTPTPPKPSPGRPPVRNLNPPRPTNGNGGGVVLVGPVGAGPSGNKHKWVPIDKNHPKCRVCGKWRDTADHTNRG